VPRRLSAPRFTSRFLMTARDGTCTNVASGTVFAGQLVPQDGIVSGGISVGIKVNG